MCSQERKPMILHLQLANKMTSWEVWIISWTTLQFLAWNSFIQSLSQCTETYCSRANLLFVAFHTAPQFKSDRLTGWHHLAADVLQNTSRAAAWEELHRNHALYNNKALASSHILNSHKVFKFPRRQLISRASPYPPLYCCCTAMRRVGAGSQD